MEILKQIERWSVLSPEKLCFVWRNRSLTYGQLVNQSNALASWMTDTLGDDHTPLLVHGSMQPEMLICFLASVKAGHPYVPIDLSIPKERISLIAENSKAQLVFSMDEEALPPLPALIVNQDRLRNIFTTHEGKTVQTQTAGDDTFYIIYTSGSTGNPKGVQIQHDALASFIKWACEDFGLEEGLVFLNQAPFSFDLSVMDLYPALTTGGTVWAIDKEMIARPKDLFSSLAESNINVWTSTPSFAEMCLMEPAFSSRMLPALAKLLFCGETLAPGVAKRLIARFPDAQIINSYGPTESTVAVTSMSVDEQLLRQYPSLPVGFCKKDCRILIVKEDGTLAKDGEKGEIVIVGPSVGKGYLGDPEKTKAAFTIIDGKRAYRTKDAGTLKNGLLFYHGRMDNQIKLHGYRIEIEDIEHHLTLCKWVKSAVVLPIKREGRYDYLLAVIVPDEPPFEKNYQLTSAIKRELSGALPAYMIPRKFIYQSRIPMTPNGKVDRKTLLSEAGR